jgi:hypothetical protein
MITGALTLGMVGGIFGILIGLVGFTIAGFAGDVSFQFLTLAIPIAGLVGAGIVRSEPSKGGMAMLVSAVAMCAVFGVHLLSLLPGLLLAIGGGLALASTRAPTTPTVV